MTYKDRGLKQGRVVLLSLGTQEGDYNLRNCTNKEKDVRRRAPEICRRVICSVCLNSKMHVYELGFHKARKRTTTQRTAVRELLGT